MVQVYLLHESVHTAAMEVFQRVVLQLFLLYEILFGLLCLSAVVAGSDQEHCSVPAPIDEDTDPCPPWFIQQEIAGDNTTVECSCGPPTHGVICDPKTCNTSLQVQYCMTYDGVTRTQVVGFCLFESMLKKIITLPSNVIDLNAFMCGQFNRDGQLCGECEKGYGPALLTNYECAMRSTKSYSWAMYLLFEFLLITVFYLVIVTFQVSATSGPLNVFIFSAQVIAYIMNKYNSLFLASASQQQLWVQIIQYLLITFYGVWNLDFFHSVIPPFCLSENITTLHALALQYVPAFYPLLLIVATYFLIELHDRNFRVLVWMWRPFYRCLAPFQRCLRWNPKASIVNTFATFLTLAYNKLIIVSGRLLMGTRVTDIRGNSSRYLLFVPTVPYFGSEHLPFAILAIVVLSTFIALPPLLLIVYPTITFQKILGCLKIRWPALHIFADVFQGCYKNRTDGTNDYRYFAAFYFILHIIILLVNVCNNMIGLGWTLSTAVLIIGSLLFALLRPYKKNWLNILDSVILASLGLGTLWVLYTLETPQEKWIELVGLIAALPLVYFVMYVAYKLLLWLGILQKCQQKSRNIYQFLQQRWRGHNMRQQELCDEEQLPDRMVNPCEYQQLSQNENNDEDHPETENLATRGAYTNDYGSIQQ